MDTKPERYMAVLEKLKAMRDVMCLRSSSGDHMLLIDCWFENSGELSRFVKNLERVDGVEKICPAIITEKIK